MKELEKKIWLEGGINLENLTKKIFWVIAPIHFITIYALLILEGEPVSSSFIFSLVMGSIASLIQYFIFNLFKMKMQDKKRTYFKDIKINFGRETKDDLIKQIKENLKICDFGRKMKMSGIKNLEKHKYSEKEIEEILNDIGMTLEMKNTKRERRIELGISKILEGKKNLIDRVSEDAKELEKMKRKLEIHEKGPEYEKELEKKEKREKLKKEKKELKLKIYYRFKFLEDFSKKKNYFELFWFHKETLKNLSLVKVPIEEMDKEMLVALNESLEIILETFKMEKENEKLKIKQEKEDNKNAMKEILLMENNFLKKQKEGSFQSVNYFAEIGEKLEEEMKLINPQNEKDQGFINGIKYALDEINKVK